MALIYVTEGPYRCQGKLALLALLPASACGDGDQPTTPAAPATGKIAFTSDRDGNEEIYVINADGSGFTRLTAHPADDFTPAWSPAP